MFNNPRLQVCKFHKNKTLYKISQIAHALTLYLTRFIWNIICSRVPCTRSSPNTSR